MSEAMNETAAESGRFPNRNRMWSVRNEQVKRVRGTSLETKEKAARMRRKQKRLVQVIRSQLIPPIWDFAMFIRTMMQNLKSKWRMAHLMMMMMME